MFIIGIIGLSCSGKTTLSEKLRDALGKDDTLLVSMDDYYKELSEEQAKILYENEALINFDCPEAINFDLMCEHLDAVLSGKEVQLPKFDLGSCVVTNYLKVSPGQYKYVIVEGVFLLCDERTKNLFNLKIWCESSEYVCALRRFIKYSRDIKGYSFDFVYNQCIKYVIPGQEKYIKPYKSNCELIFNGENEDESCVDMIAYLVKQKSGQN